MNGSLPKPNKKPLFRGLITDLRSRSPQVAIIVVLASLLVILPVDQTRMLAGVLEIRLLAIFFLPLVLLFLVFRLQASKRELQPA